MDKKDALKVLIKHSFLFSEELKEKLLLKVEIMNSDQIDTLGQFLAKEKKKAIETAPDVIRTYEEFLKKLE